MTTIPEYGLPLPEQHAEAMPYWNGLRSHELLIQRCRSCSRPQFFPRDACRHCGAMTLQWEKASGRATIHTFTVVHRPVTEAFADAVPYVLALVELEEGVRMMTNIVECDPNELSIGQPVTIVYDDVTAEVTLAKFRPATSEEIEPS